ncbi:hypothetical protein B5S31_g1231 [[Candida] boidinii]|nr:hypothetical protein B5S29_g556 [[Candida] boidinii]OWB71541.1 hypothetical protein B5S31_g1231 [[Candida] boidinii]
MRLGIDINYLVHSIISYTAILSILLFPIDALEDDKIHIQANQQRQTLLSAPSFLFSSRLIPGLKNSMPRSNQYPFSYRESKRLINSVLEECSSDAYIILYQPDIQIDDFKNFTNFGNLRYYMSQSSTILTIPNTVIDIENEKPILIENEFDNIEKILRINCNTNLQIYNVNNLNEADVPHYIDTKKRLIFINLPNLLSDKIERNNQLYEHDIFAQTILRKLPTSFNTVIYLTDNLTPYKPTDSDNFYLPINYKELPNDPNDLPDLIKLNTMNSKRAIFPDLTVFDKTRYLDIERNEKGERPSFNEPDYKNYAKDYNGFTDDTWLEKKKPMKNEDEKLIKSWSRYNENEKLSSDYFINYKILKENAILIVSVVFFTLLLILKDFIKLIYNILTNISGKKNGKTGKTAKTGKTVKSKTVKLKKKSTIEKLN